MIKIIRAIKADLVPRLDITRYEQNAFNALHEAAEAYLVRFFEDVQIAALHANRTANCMSEAAASPVKKGASGFYK